MTAENQARRTSGWEAMQGNLAEEAVVAEAILYATGGRQLTVEHGQPLTEQAAALGRQLVDDVDQAVDGAGYCGGAAVMSRATSITWTVPSTDLPARDLVIASGRAADRLNPGNWVITCDAYVRGLPPADVVDHEAVESVQVRSQEGGAG